MIKFSWAAGALVLALAGAPAVAPAQDGAADEAALRAAVAQAVWPADIVRAADRYLEAFPAAPAAAGIEQQRQQAAQAWQLVSHSDLRLYRSSFSAGDGRLETQQDLRRAALGDRAAAVRLAHAARDVGDGAARRRYVGWLQYAALLGDERASYELALHFRATDQPLLAARYETLALALGYVPAPSLDNVRK